MHTGLKFSVICLAMLVILVLPFQATALSPSVISVDMAPQSPKPNESTTISLSSYAANLDAILISWFVNGKKVSSGVGAKYFITNAPSAGTETTIRAVLNMPDGEIEKKIVLRPSVMVLLWETTDSYVPPFYRGKALPTAESQIKVVAMPEIKTGATMTNPKNLLYSWQKNYTNDTEASGYGKNSFTFVNDYLENLDNVSVTVSTLNGSNSSQAGISITATNPQISFYRNDPLLGTIWEQTIKDGHMIQSDEIIVAEPYFISPKELWSPSLVWNWFINGSLTNNLLEYRKNWLPIKVEGGVSGTSSLRLEIENNTQLLGTAGKTINVSF